MTSRRSFLIGAASLLAAPAIVKAGVLMPVRKVIVPETWLVTWGPSVVWDAQEADLADGPIYWFEPKSGQMMVWERGEGPKELFT